MNRNRDRQNNEKIEIEKDRKDKNIVLEKDRNIETGKDRKTKRQKDRKHEKIQTEIERKHKDLKNNNLCSEKK